MSELVPKKCAYFVARENFLTKIWSPYEFSESNYDGDRGQLANGCKKGKEKYGVSIPKTPDYMEGVMNLRGKFIPVCIIVFESPQGQIGVLVDAVKEVVYLAADKIEDHVVVLIEILSALRPEHLMADLKQAEVPSVAS